MKNTVVTFGLISAGIISVLMFSTIPFTKSGAISGETGMLVGYTTMVIALSTIFFAVRSYRDNHLHGEISFGKALQVGLLISLICFLGYALSWEFYFNLFAPDFMEKWAAARIDRAISGGMSGPELQALTTSMNDAVEMYKNPVLRFGFTLMEIAPVGIVISLICAVLLRKKNVATQPA